MPNQVAIKYSPGAGAVQTAFASAADGPTSPLGIDVNMLDPESMLTFFEMKMSDARGRLNGLMQDQDAINKRVATLQSFEGAMAGYAETGIKPGDAGWDDFVKSATRARDAVGADTDEGKKVQALLDGAAKPTLVEKTFDDYPTALAAAEKAGTTVNVDVGPNPMNKPAPKFVVLVPEGRAPGLSADQMKSLQGQMKAVSDGLGNDAQIRMIRIQQGVEQCSQILNLASNVMRKLDEMAMAPINNIRS